VRDLQWLRLQRMMRYAFERSSFHRRMFDEFILRPWELSSFAEFAQLPFTTARNLCDWQKFLAVASLIAQRFIQKTKRPASCSAGPSFVYEAVALTSGSRASENP
jgi:phenylacetate-coenzyme A ligase PaaK-like adenylate-forming protein